MVTIRLVWVHRIILSDPSQRQHLCEINPPYRSVASGVNLEPIAIVRTDSNQRSKRRNWHIISCWAMSAVCRPWCRDCLSTSFKSQVSHNISVRPFLPTMTQRPGLVYLQTAVPYFAVPSIATYCILSLLQWQVKVQGIPIPFTIPAWGLIALSIPARPIIYVLSQYYSSWVNKRAAASHGAILAPDVQESTFTIVSKFIQSVRNGYPGEWNAWSWFPTLTISCHIGENFLEWSKQYGNVFYIRFYTNKVASISVISAYFFSALNNNNYLKMVTNEPEHIKVWNPLNFQRKPTNTNCLNNEIPLQAILATKFDSFMKGGSIIVFERIQGVLIFLK